MTALAPCLATQFDDAHRAQDVFEARLATMTPMAALRAIEAHVLAREISREDGMCLYWMHLKRLHAEVARIGYRIEGKAS